MGKSILDIFKMSIFGILKKVLKKSVKIGGLKHNGLVHRNNNSESVTIHFFEESLGDFFVL